MKNSGFIAAAMAFASMGSSAMHYQGSGGNGGGHWVKSNMTKAQKKRRKKSVKSKQARKKQRK